MSGLDEAIPNLVQAIGEAIEKLVRAARDDDKTPLLNAFALASDAAGHTGNVEKPYAVMVGDMNGLKALNTTHGLKAGDAAIWDIGKTLDAVAQECDVHAYRRSGDEFVLFVPVVDGACSAVTEHIADRLRNVSSLYENTRISASMSFGCAIGDDGYDILFKRAEEACLVAKEQGGGVVHWSPELQAQLPINRRPQKCERCGTKFDCWVPRKVWERKLHCPCCKAQVLVEGVLEMNVEQDSTE